MNFETTKGLLKEMAGNGLGWVFSDNIYIVTDKHKYSFKELNFSKEKKENYIYHDKTVSFSINYKSVVDTSFIKRKISITFKEPVTLLKIGTEFNLSIFDEVFLYKTFYNSSGAVFGRKNNIGIAMGFENPFFKLTDNKIEFEPNIYLDSNETFTCDNNFFGMYELWGDKMRPLLEKSQIKTNGRYQPRYRCPGEGIDLYKSEIDEFNRYTKDYFNVQNKEFRFTSYNYFSNLPQNPTTPDQIETYKKHIENFAKLGGDTIILNPLCAYKMPNEDINSYWELFPEGSTAEDIYKTATEKGLKIGIYMGGANIVGSSNSPMENYADVDIWKKIDIKGNKSQENCICSKEFYNWYLTVTKNTIRKYNLSLWCWDPGPGNGFFCFSKDHGHVPGKGNYLGFRNSLKIMEDLKEEFPHLYIQGFHGNKEYGLWGFKYVDQHEGYWEYDIDYMNPVFPDVSPDRQTGDIVRFQGNINYLFRFMPFAMNHGLCHRIYQNCHNGLLDCDKLFDRNGYKFALLSAIAAGGPITTPIIPRNPEKIPGYIDFYKKCINWARGNWEYSKNTILFNNLHNFGGEAYSKLINNEGYLFIVNPYPMPINFTFIMDESIGFINSEKKVNISYIWPMKDNYLENVEYKEKITVVVPPYSIPILELREGHTERHITPMKSALPRYLNPTEETENGFKYKFLGDLLIKKYIDTEAQYIDDEVFEAANSLKKFKDTENVCWYQPNRLWLNILNTKKKPVIRINDFKLEIKPFELNFNGFRSVSGYYADITDMVIWQKENILEYEGNESPWLFLAYPRPEDELPSQITHDIPKNIPAAPILDKNIKIFDAKVNKDNIIIENTNNILSCKINIPYEKLEGVYASMPIGVGILKDMPLMFDNGEWVLSFNPVRQSLIIDDEKITLWAVTKDQRESESHSLYINWLLN